MPINFTDFSQIPVQKSGFDELLGRYRQGYEGARLPEKLRQEEEHRRLANALQGYNVEEKAIEQPYLSDKYRLANELTQAQFQQVLADAEQKRRFGGINSLSGFAKDAQSTYLLEQMLGPDHPVVQEAKRRTQLDEERIRRNMENTESLIGVRPRNALTQFGKGIQEQREVEQGFYPGAELGREPVKLPEGKQKRLENQYDLQALKKTSDPFVRRAIEQSKNIESVIEGINPEALTQYSGIKGRVKLAEEQLKDQSGKPSKDYLDYLTSKQAALALSKNVRQLMQDSVTPSAQQAIEHLTNPSSLGKSPEAARAQYDHYIKILNNEIKNFQRAVQDSSIFYGDEDEKAYAPDGAVVPPNEAQPSASERHVALKNKRTGQIEMVNEAEARRRGAIK